MIKWMILPLAVVFSTAVWAEGNVTKITNDVNATQVAADTNETNATETINPEQLDKHVKEQMEREEKYAKTQSFEQGDDYNLSEHQVDPKDLENVHVDEPLYDFNMDDVYD